MRYCDPSLRQYHGPIHRRDVLESYLRATGGLFFLLTRDGTYTDFWTSGAIPTYVQPSEFLGRRMADVLPPAIATICHRAVQDTLDTGQAQTVQYELPVDTGPRTYECRLIPHEGNQVTAVVHEACQSGPLFSALKGSEDQFRAIFDHIAEPIEVSRNGLLEYLNRAYCDLFGYDSAEELLGRPVIQLIAPASKALVSSFQTARDAGEVVPPVYTVQGVCKDGTILDLERSVSEFVRDGQKFQTVIIRRALPARGLHRHRAPRPLTAMPPVQEVAEDPARLQRLSPREVQVMQMVAQGKATKEIAAALKIDVKTAHSHRAHMMAKLGVHDPVNLLRYCIRAGLVEL